jgi:glycosyltransferase involved in cell wall biosynthesis
VITASVIIPARNAAGTLAATLDAVAAQDLSDHEVIVVDDGSTDETAEIAQSRPGVTFLRGPGAGPAPARELGVRSSAGRILAFTDADCVPSPDWLRRGVEATSDAGIVQGAVRAATIERRHPFDRTVSIDRFTGLFECANLFVTRTAFDAAGGFEDWLHAEIGKPLAEDVWLGWRVVRAGATAAFEPRAVVSHAVFPRRMGEYVAERSRLVYFPAIVRRMPEVRRFVFRRWFLTPRSAAFDLAVVAAAAAPALASALPLAAVIPYAWIAVRRAVPWRRHAPAGLVGSMAADAVGAVALVIGSVRFRSLLL